MTVEDSLQSFQDYEDFSSPVTDLVLIYESVTYESLRTNDERRMAKLVLGSPFYCDCLERRLSDECSRSESYVTTDGQSASLYWNKAPFWGLRPDF
jgi:hypothetical protein